jgi:hypothetical protein
MQLKSAVLALTLAGTVSLAGVLASPAKAMGPVGPSAVAKTDASAVEQVGRKWRKKRYYRRHVHVPRYRYRRYRSYDYSYYDPYYASPYYYRSYNPYYYGGYYGRRFYGGGIRVYGPRFGVRIGW